MQGFFLTYMCTYTPKLSLNVYFYNIFMKYDTRKMHFNSHRKSENEWPFKKIQVLALLHQFIKIKCYFTKELVTVPLDSQDEACKNHVCSIVLPVLCILCSHPLSVLHQKWNNNFLCFMPLVIVVRIDYLPVFVQGPISGRYNALWVLFATKQYLRLFDVNNSCDYAHTPLTSALAAGESTLVWCSCDKGCSFDISFCRRQWRCVGGYFLETRRKVLFIPFYPPPRRTQQEGYVLRGIFGNGVGLIFSAFAPIKYVAIPLDHPKNACLRNDVMKKLWHCKKKL